MHLQYDSNSKNSIQRRPAQPIAPQGPAQISGQTAASSTLPHPAADQIHAQITALKSQPKKPVPPQRPTFTEDTLTDLQRTALQSVIEKKKETEQARQDMQAQLKRFENTVTTPRPSQQILMQQRAAQSAMQQRSAQIAMQQRQPQQRPPQQRTANSQPSTLNHPLSTYHSQLPKPDRYKRVKPNAKYSTGSKILAVLFIVALSAAGFAAWYYWWTTYATFDYRVRPVVVLEGQLVTPDDFLYPMEDMERVTATFRRPGFRTTLGQQDVPLTLTRGWRTVETTAPLYVLTPVEQIYNEFTVAGPAIKAIDLISNADAVAGISLDLRFIELPLPLENYPVGDFPIRLALNDTEFVVNLSVTDTKPPTATAVNKTILIGEKVYPEDFVTDVYDPSPIASITFVEEPDVFLRRDQIVEIEIEDIFGNSDIFAAALSMQFNETPPVIEGADTIESLVGNPILYRQGVTAHDDFGRELELNVDTSRVNQDVEGMYLATFWVEDYSGQRTEKEVTVHVLSIDPDYVNERVDEVLAGIINSGMTQLEKAHAIHSWVRSNVSYVISRGGPQSAYEGAYRAFRDRRGNCYIFYSISEVLLTRAGIPNMRIERIPGTPTRHRWNLVNPDERGWHHFDAFPTRLSLGSPMAYFNDTQAETFMRQIQAINNMRDYYTYDPSLYPEVAR